MSAVRLGFEQRKQCGERIANISHHAKREWGTAAKILRANVDLCDLPCVRVELLVGEIRSQHEKHIAVHDGVVA